MIVELYTYKNHLRHYETRSYNRVCDWEKDYLILKMSDQWVGHKIYNTTQVEFDTMTPLERANSVVFQKFDRGAYINGKKN